MTPEDLCAAFNHPWLCLSDGYICTVCGRFFPLGIWAKKEEEKLLNLSELTAKASCPRGSCEI